MKQKQSIKQFQKALQVSLEKYYKEAISENIKRGIRARKALACRVKNCKV